MKKLLIISFVLISISISLRATTYYVQPVSENANASDSNAGTDINYPWATWVKAFNATEIQPGDTVYFRGGVYMKNLSEGNSSWYYPNRDSQNGSGYAITRDGTITDTLCYFAYPGEVPILDCSEAQPPIRLNYGIRAVDVNYVKFFGLHVRNVLQYGGDNSITGWSIQGNNLVIENCTIYNMHGHGLDIRGDAGSNNYVINCDAYHCCDSLTVWNPETGDGPGNDGSGFIHTSAGNVYFKYCRAWLCGDQGYTTGNNSSGESEQYTEYEGCWAFRNGMMKGGGSGFKMGWIAYTDGKLKQTYKNCIAAYNRWNGWKTNDYHRSVAIYCHVYNCVAYHNGWQGGVEYVSGGFEIHNVTSDTDENELKRILRNNISYDNEGNAVWLGNGALYTHDHNSWDIPITLTEADFVSLDSTGITAPRQADGSLPDNDCYNYFLRPSSSSQAINAGTDVGLTYDADSVLWDTPPTIGAFEYVAQDPPVEPILADVVTYKPHWSSSSTASTGGYIADDGGAEITARGVCWNTTGTPTITDSKTSDGTGDGAFSSTMTGLSYGTVYYVRAYGTNSAGTAYGSEMTFRTITLQHSGKIIMHNGKIITID